MFPFWFWSSFWILNPSIHYSSSFPSRANLKIQGFNRATVYVGGILGPRTSVHEGIHRMCLAWFLTAGTFVEATEITRQSAILNIVRDVMASAIRQRKEIKGIHTSEEEVKLSLFDDDMIPHLENPKDSTPRLLELLQQVRQCGRIQTRGPETSSLSIDEQ